MSAQKYQSSRVISYDQQKIGRNIRYCSKDAPLIQNNKNIGSDYNDNNTNRPSNNHEQSRNMMKKLLIEKPKIQTFEQYISVNKSNTPINTEIPKKFGKLAQKISGLHQIVKFNNQQRQVQIMEVKSDGQAGFDKFEQLPQHIIPRHRQINSNKNISKFSTQSNSTAKIMNTMLPSKKQIYSNYGAHKNSYDNLKNEEKVTPQMIKINRGKQRISAPTVSKSAEAGQFWSSVFQQIQLKGQSTLRKNSKKQQNTDKSSIKQYQKKKQYGKVADSGLYSSKSSLSFRESSKRLTMPKSEKADNFYFPQNRVKNNNMCKNSVNLMGSAASVNKKQNSKIKQTCQLSSRLLKNSKQLLSNLRLSPYYCNGAEGAQSPKTGLMLTKSDVGGYSCLPDISINNGYSREPNIKTQRSYIYQPSSNNKSGTTINLQRDTQYNEKHASGKTDETASTNFTRIDGDIPNFSTSVVTQIGASLISTFDIGQTRSRINSPQIYHIPCMAKLSDFKIIAPLQMRRDYSGSQLPPSIGHGKFGTIYLCKHNLTNSVYALKQIPLSMIYKFSSIKQLIDQLKIHSLLDHPNIVKLFGYFYEPQKDILYMIMQYICGGSLFEYINEVGKLSLKVSVSLLRDIIKAVSYMHEKSIAHRDLKPQNILLIKQYKYNKGKMNYITAKLCDFGWSALIQTSRKTYCGTFDYVPPQILQRKKYDISVDVWSIGILAYQMLTGKMPYEGDRSTVIFNKINQSQIQYPPQSQQFPIEAKQFIQALVKKNPQDRPKCKDLLQMALFKIYNDDSLKNSSSTANNSGSNVNFQSKTQTLQNPIQQNFEKRCRISNVKDLIKSKSPNIVISTKIKEQKPK